MKKLVITTHVSATLNYLVFIHNVFSNGKQLAEKRVPKFPNIGSLFEHLKSDDEFSAVFRECWMKIINLRKSSGMEVDPVLINNEWDDLAVLFKENKESQNAMRASVELFLSWWFQPYIGGSLSLETIGENTLRYLYTKCKDYLDQHSENYDVRCRLEITYDELELFSLLTKSESLDCIVVSRGQLPDVRFEEDEIRHRSKKMDVLIERLINASGI